MLALLAAAAAATPTGLEADLRCLLTSSALAGNADPKLKQAGMMSSLYWFGRVEGRLSDTALEERLTKIAETMSPELFKAEAKRCGEILQQRGTAMQAIGRGMQARAAAAAARPR